MGKILKIEKIDTPEVVFDPACEYPHSYISNGMVSHNCIMLIDEAEKLFGEGEDAGVTSRLLAQLLWFLQEHKSRIFTVITTNDMGKLPPELYRQGRIDQVLTLAPLSMQDALFLGYKVAEQLFELDNYKRAKIRAAIDDLQGNNKNFTPAMITGIVYALIKKNKWIKS